MTEHSLPQESHRIPSTETGTSWSCAPEMAVIAIETIREIAKEIKYLVAAEVFFCRSKTYVKREWR